MAQLSAIYASALFDLFLEKTKETGNSGYADDFLEHAVFMRDMLKEDECHRILLHPHISSAEKRAFFEDALAGHIHVDLLGLLNLAITKNREAFLVPAFNELIGMVERYQRKARAKVISAVPLSGAQIAALENMLSGKLDKHVIITHVADPNVIGGIYIYVDGHFIDRTVKTRLRELKSSIIEGGGL
ncbi:MAG: ATP synthase F1 subunit delta [Defluviitaleaceae bacterium]|nr:ATP synthase F1 subunit delta [Defluviitaleaceae bacterium]MCL2836945.1 ATP synthase F1 subunit delta [Defluviitaleaceae bacterium]